MPQKVEKYSAGRAAADKPARSRGNGLQERIRREIEEHARGEMGRSGWPYLNNFHCRLPGGLYRTLGTDVLDDRTMTAGAGPRLRRMTLRRFYAHIDRLIASLGLDVGRILELQAAESREIYDYAFPLYVRLREEGFRHHPDLTS